MKRGEGIDSAFFGDLRPIIGERLLSACLQEEGKKKVKPFVGFLWLFGSTNNPKEKPAVLPDDFFCSTLFIPVVKGLSA